jgi:hypothetical protein
MLRTLLCIGLFAALAGAQSPSVIAVPVSHTVTLEADQVDFTISLTAPLSTTVAQVKQALNAAGLPNPTVVATGLGSPLLGISYGGSTGTVPLAPYLLLQFSATASVPPFSATTVAQGLEALRQHPAAPLSSLTYTAAFSVSAPALEAARQAALPRMMDDARKSAQSIAAATGLKLGAVRSLSEGGNVGAVLGQAAYIYNPVGVLSATLRSGDFSSLLVTPRPVTANSSTIARFNLTVTFSTQ